MPLDLSRVIGDMVRIRLESAPAFWVVDRVSFDCAAPEEFTARESIPSRAVDYHGREVCHVLTVADGRDYVMKHGDGAELTFVVPSVPRGKARSYVLITRGWYQLHIPAIDTAAALLERMLGEPLTASRLITGDLSRAVAALERE